ncbi:hypothetical protein [Xanthomonas sp. MUS 060]|uniref:hypothetical protein n=1 Tax=Xanthomonas sp. MUS 060 TaxID=1588031 RepID=UPI000AE03D53|nr:hypothetical protein [Xanthomonas sp. MUS 060]
MRIPSTARARFSVCAFSLLRAANAGVMPELTWGLGVITALFAAGFIWLVFMSSPVPVKGAC